MRQLTPKESITSKRAAAPDKTQAATIDMSPLPDRLGYVLRHAQIAVFNDFMRTCGEFDIRPAQYAVLILIENNPGLKQIDISTALGIKRANLVPLLDHLEQRGLARREAVPSDRRSHALRLTPKGKAFLADLHARAALHEKQVNAVLGDKGRRQLLPLLRKLTEAMGPAVAEDI